MILNRYLAFAIATIVLSMAAHVEASGTAFVGVNVIPMDSERILVDQTVLVRNGRIVVIGESDVMILPEGIDKIDG